LVIGVGASKSNPLKAYIAAGQNGVGAEVLITADGGKTWTTGNISAALMFLDAGVSPTTETSAAIAGALVSEYTTDGQNFEKSKLFALGASQSAEAIGDNGFGLTGSFGSKNGIAVSSNGGASYHIVDIPDLDPNFYPARYGAFPSETTWYVTAGTWPDSQDPDEGSDYLALSQKIDISVKTHAFVRENVTDYYGAIAKTTDAGKTWTVLLNNTGKYYMNGIHCYSETSCVAVGEGGNGAYSFYTTDGETFTEVDVDTGSPYSSLMGARMVGAQEVWLAGGYMESQLKMEARFWHSTDGGKTYDKTVMNGLMMLSMDCADNAHCYAVGLNRLEQGVIALYQ